MKTDNAESIDKSFDKSFKILVCTIGTGLLLGLASHTSLLDSFKGQAADTTSAKKPVKHVMSDSLSQKGPVQR